MVGIIEWSKNTFKSRHGRQRSASAMPSMNAGLAIDTPPATPAQDPRRSSMYLLSTPNTQTPRETPKEAPEKTINSVPSRANSKPTGRRTFNRFGRHSFEPTKMQNSPELQEALDVFEHIKKSKSLKALQLAPIPHVKPITMSSLLGEEVIPTGPSKGPVIRKPLPNQFQDFSFPFQQPQKIPSFDAREPLNDPNKHVMAKLALKKRYQSKLTVDHDIPRGLSVRDYDFRWVSAEDMDRKILEDIIWVRERYAHIGKEEPTDEQIIWWYDAQAFVDSQETIGVAL